MLPELLHSLWKLECHLNRALRRAPSERSFELRAGSLEGAAVDAGAGPELCVVVTTHRRPAACATLLDELARSLARARVQKAFVLVLNDPGDTDYSPVLDALERRFAPRYAFYEAQRWLGKRNFWRTYQQAFDVVQRLGPRRTLFLQDDVSFGEDFVERVLATWDAVDDPKKAVLFLLSMPGDEEGGRWIRHRRTSALDGRLWKTQWFDLNAFLVDRRFFEILRYEVFPVPEARWHGAPSRGSGVNEQLTRRLLGRGNVYQVVESAVFHGGEASVMNPEARRARALDNRPPRREPPRDPSKDA